MPDMSRPLERDQWRVPAIVLVLIIANTLMFAASLERLKGTNQAVTHTLTVQRDLSEVLIALSTAEAGQRGYLLTGDPRHLAPFQQAVVELDEKVALLGADVADNTDELAEVERIGAIGRQKVRQLAATVDAFVADGEQSAVRTISPQRDGGPLMAELHDIVETMKLRAASELNEQQSERAVAYVIVYMSAVVFILGTVVLLVRLFLHMSNQLKERSQTARELKTYAESLDHSVETLERERNEITEIYEAGSYLQSCNSLGELDAMSPQVLAGLFPGLGGELVLYSASRNQLTSLSAWGGWTPSGAMAPDECWALRGGKSHYHADNGRSPACDHVGSRRGVETLCVPLLAHGETVGLLILADRTGSRALGSAILQRKADLVARQLSLTIANLRLRETLNDQTTRDPLTQVLNRRYLDNVGKREMALAARSGRKFGVVMLDIDNFKRFNDVHGHAAGDVALTAVAGCLQRSIRDSDWIFRFGGEEFVLLLRDSDGEAVEETCDALRRVVERLQLEHNGQVLPGVTVSIGATITDGTVGSFEDVLAVADKALFAGKGDGRNRVVMAPPQVGGSQAAPVATDAA